jgi:hypothetical protein
MEEAMMPTKLTQRLACCTALAFGAAAMAAQQRTTPAPEERGNLDEIRKISTLIGTNVMNRAHAKVATVRDLVMSPSGDVLYAILGRGGLGGVGESDTAAPIDALDVRHADGQWTVSLDKTADEIKNAPPIESSNYRELTEARWIARACQCFRTSGGANARSQERIVPAQPEPRAVEWVLLATKIRAAKLKNTQNVDLGKVEDILLGRMNRAAFLIVGSGGVLGIGEQYIPVPWSRVGLATNAENAAITVSIDSSKAHLERAPVVKGDYANLLAPGFADEVRRYFGAVGSAPRTGTENERR